jgi:hypothetical protein
VAGLGIRLFTDEHISDTLARALKRRGYDVESCEEAGRANRGIPDEEQLTYATQHGRAILTFNRNDFLRLDAQWKRVGQQHGGIIISVAVRDVGELLRRVERHLDICPPSVQHDTLLWLDPSPTR